ncbi:MAG: hypothetical protein LBU36_00420 [Clostridiales bacterium]|jgi:hypothetical protein|nr:hypothetical protein [Clostridiales bacterium]
MDSPESLNLTAEKFRDFFNDAAQYADNPDRVMCIVSKYPNDNSVCIFICDDKQPPNCGGHFYIGHLKSRQNMKLIEFLAILTFLKEANCPLKVDLEWAEQRWRVA